jgi:catechol-2,3-dioxygenase
MTLMPNKAVKNRTQSVLDSQHCISLACAGSVNCTQQRSTFSMKEITRINHLGIRVKNIEVSRDFYEKLGYEFIAGPL